MPLSNHFYIFAVGRIVSIYPNVLKHFIHTAIFFPLPFLASYIARTVSFGAAGKIRYFYGLLTGFVSSWIYNKRADQQRLRQS
jgi:hypothetical protein